jgi:CRP-like cAMP-binding protein
MFREYLRLDEVQRIADVLEIVKYPKGTQIIKKGDEGTIFYILKEGSVLCTDIGSGDKTFPDVTLGQGKYFGERALISKDPRAASVVAVEDVVLLSLNGNNFESLLGGLNSRMAAAAEEEDLALKSGVGAMMARLASLGKPAAKKPGWTLTTRPDVALDALQEVARLGSGSFGFVRMVLHEASGEVFALKAMLREDIKAQSSEQSVMDEKELMAEVAHPFIVNLVNT